MISRILQLSEPNRSVVYVEAGRGEPVVLIHGVGTQAAAWAPQIEALAGTHRVMAVNMPGHGGSSTIPDGATLPDYVVWLSEVVCRLECDAVNLAGHSMGALIVAGFAIEHPERTHRLAVLNGVYRRTPEARKAVSTRAAEIAAGRHDIEGPLSRWFGDSVADQAARRLASRWLAEVNHRGYAAAYRAFAEGDHTFADRWPEIGCPTLVLTGSDDLNSTPAMARDMASAAQQGVVVVIEGHRHMVNLTAPDRVTAAMRDWLQLPIDVRAHEGAQ